MSNYVTKTIITILTDAEVHMLVDGLSYLDGEESANLERHAKNVEAANANQAPLA